MARASKSFCVQRYHFRLLGQWRHKQPAAHQPPEAEEREPRVLTTTEIKAPQGVCRSGVGQTYEQMFQFYDVFLHKYGRL